MMTITVTADAPRPTRSLAVEDVRGRLDAAGWSATEAPRATDRAAWLTRLPDPSAEEGSASTAEPPAVIPLNDARTGGRGLLLLRQNRVDVILEAGTLADLRNAAERLFDILGVKTTERSTQSTEDGERSVPERVRGVTRAGSLSSAATSGAPLVLWVITLALALVSVTIAAAVGENSTQGWLADWAHATLDRVFTGALGAALVATVMAAQRPPRTPPTIDHTIGRGDPTPPPVIRTRTRISRTPLDPE